MAKSFGQVILEAALQQAKHLPRIDRRLTGTKAGFRRLHNHPAKSKTVLFNSSCYLWILKLAAIFPLMIDVKLQTLNQTLSTRHKLI